MNEAEYKTHLENAIGFHSETTRELMKYDRYYQFGILQGNPTNNTNTDNSNTKNDKPSSNQVYKYMNLILPLLYYTNPNINYVPNMKTNKATKALLENSGLLNIYGSIENAKITFSQLLSDMQKYSYNQTRTMINNIACVFSAVLKGRCYTKTSFNSILGLDQTECVKREELWTDSLARYDLSQCRIVIQICTNDIDTAKSFFEPLGVKDIQANMSMSELKSERQEKASSVSNNKTLYRYYELWDKTTQKRCYFDDKFKKLIELPWPFKLDYDDFPYEELTFNKNFDELVNAFSEITTVEGLWKFYEFLIYYFYDDTMKSLAQPVIFDSAVISQPIIEQILGSTGRQFFPMENLEKRKLDDLFHIPDIGKGSDTPLKYIPIINQMAEANLGIDSLNVASMQNMKDVRQAPIEMIEEANKVKVSSKQSTIDRWLQRQAIHRTQVQRQLVSSQTVEELLDEESARLWDLMNYNEVDIIREYSIEVVAGSTSERAKGIMFNRLKKMYDMMKEVNETAGMPIYDLIKVMREMIKYTGESNVERFENKQITNISDKQTRQPVYPNKQNVEGILLGIKSGMLNGDEGRSILGLGPLPAGTIIDTSVLDEVNKPEIKNVNVETPIDKNVNVDIAPIEEVNENV